MPHTYHGGCPVLAGSKWITNKWIRSWSQFKHFPCATSNYTKGAATPFRPLHPIDNDFCKMSVNCDIPAIDHLMSEEFAQSIAKK